MGQPVDWYGLLGSIMMCSFLSIHVTCTLYQQRERVGQVNDWYWLVGSMMMR